MKRSDLDMSQSTLRPDTSPTEGGRARVPLLTVLFHPDLDRVGEVAALFDGDRAPAQLSRTRPLFAQPGAAEARGLDDLHLSRRPALLSPDGDGVRISTVDAGMEVRVDRAPIPEARRLSAAALEQGVVLELARRVVLLVHLGEPPGGALPPRLGLVGASPAIEELRRGIVRVAALTVPVLIRGETGTGKDLVARAVHAASGRAGGPYVAVNLAAIPASTAAAQLFGHARGAFTGAVASHGGYFEQAAGGTLFLDELGATPADVQPLLLRALESGEVQPIGALTPRPVDVRLIAATDAALEDDVSAGSFRGPLLHRLEGAQLFVPPLRSRREDIGRLAAHFLRLELEATGDLARVAPEAQRERTWIPASLFAELAGLAWPGNVRQLRSAIRQLAVSSRAAPRARIDEALARLLEMARGPRSAEAPLTEAPVPEATRPARERRDPTEISDDEIVEAMRACEHVANDAAARLGVSRSYLYERIKGIDRIRRARDLSADDIAASLDACGRDVTAAADALGVSVRALRARMRELKVPSP